MPEPILSVIMPVYNAERYVGAAIESILQQTFPNLELIIIDDGSLDNSVEKIHSFKDDRIRLTKNNSNRGIVYSRNRGLLMAKGEYIGMLDADDIAYPEKFKEQIYFLEQNKDFGMVGSWARFIDEGGNFMLGSWKLKASPEMIPSIMLFKNYFLQSAVLYRKECISKFSFKEGFDILEDYLIWYEITRQYKSWNLQKYLVDYRIHPGGVTKKHKDEKKGKEKRVFRIQLKELGIDASDEEMYLHMLIRSDRPVKKKDTLILVEKWLLKIIRKNSDRKIYDQKMLARVVFNRWLKVCYKASVNRLTMMRLVFTSKIFSNFMKSYTILQK